MEASAVPRPAPTGVTGVASPQLLRLASDARLVTLVRQGWPAAFEAVYNRHHRGILSFCRHVLSDADEAEDAVQHTFLAAYNDLIASDKPIHLRAWLFTIARNRCYSILRSRREQPAADLDEPVTEGLATQVQRRQDLRDLVLDLRGLPDEQRAALVLAELDALSHEQIGEALGVPREKVKALVFQARESLVASRTARDTACADIREQLSTGRGGALRRANLRRHLRDCPGCRDYRRQVERQRRQLAALLPVAPTLALKQTVLAGTGTTGAGFGGGGLLASSALKSGMVKGFATLMLATAGTAGTYVATHAFQTRPASRTARAQPAAAAPSSAAGLNPTHRAAPATASIDRDTVVAAPLSGTPTITGSIPSTLPAHVRFAVSNPFGPLVHSHSVFPRKAGSRRQAIAPPKSNGQAPSPPTLAPVTAASVPVAAISSTLPPPSIGDAIPVSDRPSTDPGASTGNARGVTGSSGASRSRAAAGRPLRAPGDRRRSSAGRAAGRRITDRNPSRGSGDGRSAGASTRAPGSSPAPTATKPRGAPGDATAAGSADSGTNDGHGTDLGAGLGIVLGTVPTDAGLIAVVAPSAGDGGPADSAAVPSVVGPAALAPAAVTAGH